MLGPLSLVNRRAVPIIHSNHSRLMLEERRAGTRSGIDQAEFARQIRQMRQSLDTIDDTSLVDLTHLAAFRAVARAVADSPSEVSAENKTVNLRALVALRRRLV